MVAPLARGSGASSCVVRGAPGVLPVLPVSVRGRLRGGEGVYVRGVGLGVMSYRRLPSLRVSWRVFLQAPGDIRVVLGRGEVAGVDSPGLERIGLTLAWIICILSFSPRLHSTLLPLHMNKLERRERRTKR